MQRRLRVLVERAQIDMLDLTAAGTPKVEPMILRRERHPDHRRPAGFMAPLHQAVPFLHGFDAERLLRGVVLAAGLALFPFLSLSLGRIPMRVSVAGVDGGGQAARDWGTPALEPLGSGICGTIFSRVFTTLQRDAPTLLHNKNMEMGDVVLRRFRCTCGVCRLCRRPLVVRLSAPPRCAKASKPLGLVVPRVVA